jgi:hypothetical protein
MRLICVLQGSVLAVLAGLVYCGAGLAGSVRQAQVQGWIWVAVAFWVLSLLLKLVTPSPRERRLWAPVAAAMLLSSAWVAIKT